MDPRLRGDDRGCGDDRAYGDDRGTGMMEARDAVENAGMTVEGCANVIPGLDPGIHVFVAQRLPGRGWPQQVRG